MTTDLPKSSLFLALEANGVMDLLADEGQADAFLVSVIENGIGDHVYDDAQADARRALHLLAYRALSPTALPMWEVR